MISINLVRENKELVKEGVKNKNLSPDLVDQFLSLDENWKTLRREIDDLRASQKNIGITDKDAARLIKESVTEKESVMRSLELERDRILSLIPNIPHSTVPTGKDEASNEVIKHWGDKPEFSFQPKDYMEIAKDSINTESASKISGSRFGYILGELAELEFALLRFAVDTLKAFNFRLTIPPVLIKPQILRRTGKGKFIDEGDAFHVKEDDLYLVASSEQSLIPMFMDQTVDIKDPIRLMGFSSCFRREAGSYGKDTKGILRVHQFNKLEMVSFCNPNDSYIEHDFLLSLEEKIIQSLGLHYRVVINCSGDMGFDASKQYDIETWFPSQLKYRETNSCSNTTDFQSRGLSIVFKSQGEDGKQKNEFVHTLNATVFSERLLLAILENFQTEDGSVVVPQVLRPYLGKDKIFNA